VTRRAGDAKGARRATRHLGKRARRWAAARAKLARASEILPGIDLAELATFIDRPTAS